MPATTLNHTAVTPHRSTPNTATLLATDVAKSYARRTVLHGIDLRAAPGHRVGIVGENGAGKSTLLRLLAGVETPDSGVIERPVDFGYLPQEPEMFGTVATVLADALAPLHSAVRRVETLSATLAHDPNSAAAYAAALEWAELHDAWGAQRRTELAADRPQLRRLDQAAMADRDRMQRPFQLVAPEGQELVELGEERSQIIFLPDERLQERGVIGQAVENIGRRQTVSFQLTAERN